MSFVLASISIATPQSVEQNLVLVTEEVNELGFNPEWIRDIVNNRVVSDSLMWKGTEVQANQTAGARITFDIASVKLVEVYYNEELTISIEQYPPHSKLEPVTQRLVSEGIDLTLATQYLADSWGPTSFKKLKLFTPFRVQFLVGQDLMPLTNTFYEWNDTDRIFVWRFGVDGSLASFDFEKTQFVQFECVANFHWTPVTIEEIAMFGAGQIDVWIASVKLVALAPPLDDLSLYIPVLSNPD
jgi:hypothetical protein